MTDKMTEEQALDAVRNVLQRAYNSAEPVCCGRAGTECCGSPEPEWSEYDQQIMNDLQPVEEYLSKALSAPRVPDVDSLAQIIREVDGNHSLGAGALAEAIIGRITASQSPAEQSNFGASFSRMPPYEYRRQMSTGDARVTAVTSTSHADETCPECGQTGSHREGCPDTYLIGYELANLLEKKNLKGD